MATPVVATVALLSLLWLAAVEGTDLDALLAFKAGVTADPTGALRSWTTNDTGTAASVCRWAGVNCSSAGRVTSLDVSSRGIEGTLSQAVGDLEYLDFLNLTDNALSGPIPASLGKLKLLSFLSLCDNAFSGEIPGALRGLEKLTVLYLNNNHLTGGLPAWLGTMPALVYLTLNKNELTGIIPPELANLTTIQMLRLDENFLEGDIPVGLARLPRLQLFNVYGNRLTGEIPRGFFNMSSLQGFSLAKNAFHGELPPDAGMRSPNLLYLYLGGNRLSGTIPASLANATQLQVISLANNNFSGQVPVEIGRLCLRSLQLSSNRLTATDASGWEFLDNLTNCNALYEIIFDDNNLSGAMPSSIARLSPQFRTLSLAGNRISGVIPPGITNIVGLQTLDLQYNLLTGVIPDGIGKLKNLQELQLQGNELTGPVPYGMGDLTSLLRLDLSDNSLTGSIPPSLGNLQRLTLLNLSSNGLAGHVPTELFGLSSLSSAMDLSGNQLDGVLPREVGQLVNLARMALSGNHFIGDVPVELGSCQSLEFLDMDGNLFTGSIPPSLSRLKGLTSLNLSSNRLTGAIPPELGQMSGLQELDVSDNNLDGQVPLHGVFANKTGFNMAGNSALCGGALQLRLPPCLSLADSGSTRGTNLLLKIALPIIGAALCLPILLTVLWRRRKTKSSTETTAACIRSVVNGNFYPRVSYAELAKATDGFAEANLVGAGKFGSVYRGTLFLNKAKNKPAAAHEAVAVAVKVFDLRQVGASKTFLSECETLRSARHRNLISIVTCCSSVDAADGEFRALVFDFMPNSSLDRWLHPEYGTTGSVSAAGDAYSFGITLLEILVGKAPTDGGLGEGRTLPEFVTAAFPERIEQVLDPTLLPIEEPDVAISISTVSTVSSFSEDSEVRVTARDCLVSAVRVALSCCRRAPHERMNMKEAAAEMHLIRNSCLRACGAKPSVLEA
ncbi:hypothetical protein ACQ4PT_011022 [Festuca glaucescens]